MPDQPSPIAPEALSAILRDPSSPMYPTQITVFCDHCGREHTGDYLVSDDMDRAERLAVARKHLADNEGWKHDKFGDDFCPEHASGETPKQATEAQPGTESPCSVPDSCEDGELCDRHETERAHAEGEHAFCGVTCEVEFPTEMLRNTTIAGGIPGTAGMLDELLRRAATQPVRPVLAIVSAWCVESNDTGGIDAGDLAWRLEQAGYPLPDTTEEIGR